MDQEFRRLLSLHELASKHGQGLKPELYELLKRRQDMESETVRLLETRFASAGTAHHTLSQSELEDRDIPIVGRAETSKETKAGTDG